MKLIKQSMSMDLAICYGFYTKLDHNTYEVTYLRRSLWPHFEKHIISDIIRKL